MLVYNIGGDAEQLEKESREFVWPDHSLGAFIYKLTRCFYMKNKNIISTENM